MPNINKVIFRWTQSKVRVSALWQTVWVHVLEATVEKTGRVSFFLSGSTRAIVEATHGSTF